MFWQLSIIALFLRPVAAVFIPEDHRPDAVTWVAAWSTDICDASSGCDSRSFHLTSNMMCLPTFHHHVDFLYFFYSWLTPI